MKEKKDNGRQIRFGELDKLIQQYADENYDGNFSMAVRKLVEKALGV